MNTVDLTITITVKGNLPGLSEHIELLLNKAVNDAFSAAVPVVQTSHETKTAKLKNCIKCGAEFYPLSNRQQYCVNCKSASKKPLKVAGAKPQKPTEKTKERPKHTKVCQRCGETFTTVIESRNFCYKVECLKKAEKAPQVAEEKKRGRLKKTTVKANEPVIENVVAEQRYKHTCASCGRTFFTQFPGPDRTLCNPHCKPLKDSQNKEMADRLKQNKVM